MSELVFDFRDREASNGWEGINDVVMGGRSDGRVSWDSEGFLVFAGAVSFENGGGFSSVRSPVLDADLGDSEGIVINVRGDGKTYKLTVRTDPGFDGISYQASFGTDPGVWRALRLPFSEFTPTYHGRRLQAPPPAAREIRRLGLIIADRQEGPFRLELSSIGVF